MIVQEQIKHEWKQFGSILAFPYGWQQPAKTEQWVYEQLLTRNLDYAYAEYIAFPWATLIDLLDRKQEDKAQVYLEALKDLPAKKVFKRVTACQHVYLSSAVELMKTIGITDIFWAHKQIDQDLIEQMRIEPLALYPVAYFEVPMLKPEIIAKRKYLYSFIGAYDPGCYMSDIRKTIFDINPKEDILIKKRKRWHFDDQVYKAQIYGEKLTYDDLNEQKRLMQEYSDVLSNTIFSLCPSGAGPNSIRYWESLAFGCIPVLLSDRLELPSFGQQEIRLMENQLSQLDSLLIEKKSFYIDNHISQNEKIVDRFLSNLFDFLKI